MVKVLVNKKRKDERRCSQTKQKSSLGYYEADRPARNHIDLYQSSCVPFLSPLHRSLETN